MLLGAPGGQSSEPAPAEDRDARAQGLVKLLGMSCASLAAVFGIRAWRCPPQSIYLGFNDLSL